MGSAGSNPARRVKDIYTTNIQNTKVNILIIANLQAGSYEVFPKSSKETSKYVLFMPCYPNGKELVLKTSDASGHCRFESCARRLRNSASKE